MWDTIADCCTLCGKCNRMCSRLRACHSCCVASRVESCRTCSSNVNSVLPMCTCRPFSVHACKMSLVVALHQAQHGIVPHCIRNHTVL